MFLVFGAPRQDEEFATSSCICEAIAHARLSLIPEDDYKGAQRRTEEFSPQNPTNQMLSSGTRLGLNLAHTCKGCKLPGNGLLT